ncbi:hypothetical protein CHLRE_01g043817v5 [Chlamydomonas reinhardtii]|uniref:Uncharacterized protein n=1 Tax=Chlamydomonas reinhardtii TaxID=3055 RepID=A0A2K3E7L2_CHLRE|nr:uncharacterized protein CHLRE_01g043817v5 [Chlamydomonas reinhardtii]XP_042928761.1 uncharacterized protein CHLRE_01g043817v5 [Chlamydomonas reinhardtii]PNW88770.1 hypothetical protein CHLRE_01g043817v5 [Chlamydomonas reinhardtii]PNW88771.1 hypothetical protein CHLRE_01g043817v5 [Chlamydomonas reinhardtii]
MRASVPCPLHASAARAIKAKSTVPRQSFSLADVKTTPPTEVVRSTKANLGNTHARATRATRAASIPTPPSARCRRPTTARSTPTRPRPRCRQPRSVASREPLPLNTAAEMQEATRASLKQAQAAWSWAWSLG